MVTGINSPSISMSFHNCILTGLIDFCGVAFNCICGIIQLDDSGTLYSTFYDCKSSDYFPAIFVVNNHILHITGYTGPLSIQTVNNAASRVYIHAGDSSPITLADSCTLGQTDLYGDIILTDNSAGSTVNDYTIRARINRQLFELPLPATAYTAQVQLTTVAGNKALGSITIAGLPAGATIQHIFMYLKFGERENTNVAVNSISGAQNIQAQKGAGAFSTGIALAGGEYSTVASSGVVGGDVMTPTTDLAALAPGNGDVLTFRWTNGLAAQNNLNLNNVQVSLRAWYSV